jgi:glutathione S-transferase
LTDDRLKLYGDSRSGNCYKIQLLCAELQIEYDWQEVDILAGDTRTPEFLAMNANGRIPLLALPDGRYLPESNAILFFLAEGSELFAGDAMQRAQILQWMFFEQYSHEPYIATSRFIIKYLGNPADKQASLAEKSAGGHSALAIMEQQLLNHSHIAGDRYNIADIALFAYTHVAGEGGFSLHDYPAIRAWIERIEERPAFVPMAEK